MERPDSHSAATGVAPAPARALLLCAAFVVIGACLRLPLLDRSVWFDEACMSNQRVGSWAQLLATLYVDIHPPLYVTFMHFWNGLFGDSALSMRLPPLLCGLGSIPLLFWTGRNFVGDRAALWGAGLLAISPVHVWYSVEARLYSPMVFCTLLLIGTFERLICGRVTHPRTLWTLHLLNLLVMLSLHYYLAVPVATVALLAPLLARDTNPNARPLLLAHGLGIVLLGVFVFAKRALGEFETSQDYLRTLDLPGLFELICRWCWTGNTLAASDLAIGRAAASVQVGLGIAVLAAGLWQVVRSRREHRLAWLVPVFLMMIPGFLLATASIGLGKTYIERSCLPALPFVFLLAGCGITALPRRWQWTTGGAVLLTGAASLVALFAYHQTRWTVYKPNSDWRSAAAYLGAEIDAGAAGRPVFTSTPNPRSLPYYDVRIQDQKDLTDATSPERIGRAVRSHLGTWFGNYAEATFRTFSEHNQTLLAQAALRVYPCAADPADLDLGHRLRDDICYLVRDEWHPAYEVDHTVEDLVQHPRITVLETKRFQGLTVHKVRVKR